MLKTLAKSIRQYKRESILSPVLVTLEVLLECMIPLYMSTMLKDITDEPTGHGGVLAAVRHTRR